jgi:hypothetical protein
MNCIELLEQRIKDLELNNGQLIVEKAAMAMRIQELENALRRLVRIPPRAKGEGLAGEISAGIRGLADPDPDPNLHLHERGYHEGSNADPRD